MNDKQNTDYPILEDWYLSNPGRMINPIILTNCIFIGVIYNHPNLKDGHSLSTSKFKRFVSENVIETERGYFYRLGTISDTAKKLYPDIEKVFKLEIASNKFRGD